jgi:hypothetical protein
MERTGIEPVTSGLQSRENEATADDARRRAAMKPAWLQACRFGEAHS